MTKDSDSIKLLDKYGAPPQLIWVTCGNTSNAKMRDVLAKTLKEALNHIKKGEVIVEISDK